MTNLDTDDVDVDSFLESDESIEDLLKSEYDVSWYFEKHGSGEDLTADLQPETDIRDDVDDDVLPDQRLIRGKGIAFSDLDVDDVGLDAELSPEEEVASTHSDDDTFSDPALNAVYKSTMNERAEFTRSNMNKRELLDLAADMVDEYFRKHVKTDGIEEGKLNKIKFVARQRVARALAE